MTNNYFKVAKFRTSHLVFFNDTSPTEIASAFTRASNLATRLEGKLSVYVAASVPGPWSQVPVVGWP